MYTRSSRAQFHIQFVLVIAISVLTAILTSYFLQNRFQTGVQTKTEKVVERVESSAAPLSLSQFNETLVGIAERVKPSVVTVFTEQVVRVRRPMMRHPFFGAPGFEDFFENFFGPRGGRPSQPNQSPYDEYRRQGLGSGVIVSADGYILTNNHVIAEADEIQVRTLGKKTFEAKVIGRDPKTDIAVIKIDANNLTPIESGSSDALRVGELVLAVGSPMNPNLAHTVTQGIVSATGRSNVGLADYEDFIQTDAAINPGNSGGALVNIRGELIGINTAIVSQSGGSQGIGFAVPIDMARAVMNSLIEKGEVVRGWLGVAAQDLTEELVQALGLPSKDGVLISNVDESGPAAKAGIKSGDVLVEIDGEKIESGVELRNRISQMSPGKSINVKLIREGAVKQLKIKLARLDAEGPDMETPTSPKSQEQTANLIGFKVTALSDEIRAQLQIPAKVEGVVIQLVDPASAAAKAGVREGDVIVSMNRKAVQSVDGFVERAKKLKKGESLLLQVSRRGMNMFVAFQL